MPKTKSRFIPKPRLARSNAHHDAMGSSHRNMPNTAENWHRPQHEFSSDKELSREMLDDIEIVRTERGNMEKEIKGERGKQFMLMYRMIHDSLMLDLRYLDVIGRLPEGINISQIEVELNIPTKFQ